MDFSYNLIPQEERLPNIGLVVLQTDETIENELRQLIPASKANVHVTRVPNGLEVSEESLADMANWMTEAASLFPRSIEFDVVAYCCTSGSSVIGLDNVERLVKAGCKTKAVTNPVSALLWACEQRKITNLGFLSPYVEEVNSHLRNTLSAHGVSTPYFGSFNEAEDAKVAHIDRASIENALMAIHGVASGDDPSDAYFMSCTSLKTVPFLDDLVAKTGKPVLSSNFVVYEHLMQHLKS